MTCGGNPSPRYLSEIKAADNYLPTSVKWGRKTNNNDKEGFISYYQSHYLLSKLSTDFTLNFYFNPIFSIDVQISACPCALGASIDLHSLKGAELC